MIELSGTVFSNVIGGKSVHFFVADKTDVIQRHHALGKFYEIEELDIISEFFPRGGVFVDIGANVGNHAIYVGIYLEPSRVIAFEPNPPAIELLNINLALNCLKEIVDISNLGVGLSDAEGTARPVVPASNLGGTRLVASDRSDGLKLILGDSVLAERRVDFIKLDVEGMEMLVLSVLAKTIAKSRPPIFIEVEERNTGSFMEWINENKYSILRRFRRYKNNENYMFAPTDSDSLQVS